MEENGVNYYKGVLLCSRPNQSPSVNKEKPFCGRVFPRQSLGLVPTKHYNEHQIEKRKLPVLSNHKKWLQSFQKKIKEKKSLQQNQHEKEQEKVQKIKKQAAKQRQNIKNSQVTDAAEANNSNQKGKNRNGKPLWAQTEKQVEQNQQAQVDDVLDFFQKGQLKDYLSDDQVNKVLQDLKDRIENLKAKGEDWKKKEVKRIRQQGDANEQASRNKDKDDILSRISRQSGSQSLASQKTAQRVQQLEQKKNEKEWDKYTNTEKKSMASVDDQIAKNVADEVLRNYPNLKHHSNQSIRKLLQRQAHDEIKK